MTLWIVTDIFHKQKCLHLRQKIVSKLWRNSVICFVYLCKLLKISIRLLMFCRVILLIYTSCLAFCTCKWVQKCWSSATWCGEGFWSHPVSRNCTSWPPHSSTVQECHWKAWQCCCSLSTSVWPPAYCCCSAHLLSALLSRTGAASQGCATHSTWPSRQQ